MDGMNLWERRQFLAALSAAGAAAMLPGSALAAGAYKPRRIDVHHHVLPPAYNDFVASGKSTFVSPIDISKWTLQSAIDDMAANGVETAIVSAPDFNGNLPGDIVDVIRACNEWQAQIVRDNPRRFGTFGSLPLPNVDACLKEVTYAYDTLHVDGMRAQPSYNGKYLGHADFAPIWDELNKRKGIMFVHPTQPQCCGPVIPNAPSATLEFPYDTTRTMTDLLLTGTFTKYPDIRWIFSHGGGVLPMIAGRIGNTLSRVPRLRERVPNGAEYEFKKLYVDTASAFYPASFAGMAQLYGTKHILFGTDIPYVPIKEGAEGVSKLKVDAKARADIDRNNALGLFPRLQKI